MYCYFNFKYGNCGLVFIAAYTGLLNESNSLVCKCLNSEGKKHRICRLFLSYKSEEECKLTNPILWLDCKFIWSLKQISGPPLEVSKKCIDEVLRAMV